MKFTNAFEGVKKIFAAEILALIASVCGTIALALPVVALVAAANQSGGGTAASLGGLVVVGIATVVLSIIAFIFKLIGVNKASKDEPAFKIAFYMILAGIVVSVLTGIFSSNSTVSSIMSAIGEIVNLAVTVYIIQGIKNLAQRLGDDKMVKSGDTLFKYIIAIYILVIIAQIVIMILQNGAAVVVALVIIVISGILEIIQYILYIRYLAKAKKMLA